MTGASTTDARKRNAPTKKVVISECFGGFSLSLAAIERMGLDRKQHYDYDRTDPKLIEAVEALGKEASGRYANLKVVEIPADMSFHIHEYDGYESVHEDHRTYGSTGVEEGCS